jgi:hypothetical protein
MKRHLSPTAIVFILALTALIIGFSAFSQKEKSTPYSFRKQPDAGLDSDTATRRQHDKYLTDKDLDKINAAMEKLDEEMERLDDKIKKMDLDKVQKTVDEAMQKIDFKKMNRQLEQSMKQLDHQKLQREMKETMARVEKVDMPRIKIEMDRARRQLEREHTQFNSEHVKEQLRDARKHAEEGMKHARESMEKAREELRGMRDFTNELQKDGLIDKKKGYKIELKSGELYINDQKQPKEVNDKYRKYHKKENFTIKTDADEGVRI